MLKFTKKNGEELTKEEKKKITIKVILIAGGIVAACVGGYALINLCKSNDETTSAELIGGLMDLAEENDLKTIVYMPAEEVTENLKLGDLGVVCEQINSCGGNFDEADIVKGLAVLTE